MGGVLSRFGKRPKNSREILEDLDKRIQYLSQRRLRSQQYEKSFIGFLLILSFLAYLVGALVFYIYFLPKTWLEGVLNSFPLLLFPFVVYLVKKLLNIYFHHQKSQYDHQLRTLQEEKRRVLNEVMEKETYNTAREILERFDPSHPSLRAPNPATQNQERQQNTPRSGSEVRQRRPPQTPHPAHPALMRRPIPMATPQTAPPVTRAPVAMPTPTPPPSTTSQQPPPQGPATSAPAEPPVAATTNMGTAQFILPGMCLGPAPGPPIPSPILPRERSGLDKVVEYLVGDGPNNRFALICSECHSHNGMALRDEFEYITFRCAYCYHLNPARKRKPTLQPSSSSSPPSTPLSTQPPDSLEPNNINQSADTAEPPGGTSEPTTQRHCHDNRSEATSHRD